MRKKTKSKKVAKKKPAKRKAGKKPQGRPKKYNASYVKQARVAARHGAADNQLAELFCVAPSRIVDWKIKYPEFAEAIEEGRAEFDTGQVELSLRQQALPHDEVTEIRELRGRNTKKDPKGRKMTTTGERRKKKVVNVHAAVTVLKADKPEKYGDTIKLPDVSDVLKDLLKEIGSGGSGLPISER